MSASTVVHDSHVDPTNLQNCKKCTLPIVEGHAYELGDDRWHINCFKCSKCSSSLGCNSNFLILGNGNLICSNCSYNCKQCGKKIDDLAILTGDQAYCSNCFKCRSCKQKIEDLRYARTSKGLFCMSCHEKLMAKKRKYDLKKRQLLEKQAKDLSQLESHDRAPLQETHITQQRILSQERFISTEKLAAGSPSSDPHKSQDTLASAADGFQVRHPSGTQSESSFKDASEFSFNIRPTSTQHTLDIHMDETPLVQPKPQAASTKSMSRSDFYDLYNRSPSTTPKLDDVKVLPDPPQDRTATPDSQSTATGAPSIVDKENIVPKRNQSQEFSIEEINDSDDELNARKTFATRVNTPPLATIPHMTPETPVVAQELAPAPDLRPPGRTASPNAMAKFQGKNVLILSPGQGDSGSLRSPDSLDRNNLHVTSDKQSKSACASPMAKVNRHARVLETDNINDDEITDDDNDPESLKGRKLDSTDVQTPDRLEFSTPRKNVSRSNTVASPPPRFPLPSVPTPKQSFQSPQSIGRDSYEDTHGLGLEGIEYYDYDELTRRAKAQAKSAKPITNATPSVTNLEEDEGSPQTTRDSGLSRKQSLMRTPILNMRHKRSVSGGSNGGGMGRLNIFKSKDDRQGHSRNVSEGSIKSNGSSAFVTPPLPFNNHNRSSSDTQYSSKTFDIMNLTTDHDVKNIRLEVYQLESKKTVLHNELKKMNSEKTKLLEELDQLRAKIQQESAKHAELVRSNSKPPKLDEPADVVPQIIHHSSSSSTINYLQTASASTSNQSAATEDDSVETQKATRLKFWKRAKMGFNPQPNIVSTNSQDEETKRPFGLMSRSRSNNIIDTLINGGSTDEEAPLFNSSIQRRASFENQLVPMIVSRCIKEVEARGLDMEGIYRISGGNSAIISIESAFAGIDPKNKDEKLVAKLDELLDGDINAVSSALKRYLRKIPDPLIPFAIYKDFIKLNSVANEEKRAEEFKSKILDKLPSSNKEVLHTLCKHLELINSYSSVNRMNYRNLSVVFAPTIARDETGEREMTDMGHRNDVTEFLFCHYTKMF